MKGWISRQRSTCGQLPVNLPQRTLGEGVSLVMKTTDELPNIAGTEGDGMEDLDEDILVNLGVPSHSLATGHCVGVCK